MRGGIYVDGDFVDGFPEGEGFHTSHTWLHRFCSSGYIISVGKRIIVRRLGPTIVFNGCCHNGLYTVATEKWQKWRRTRWQPISLKEWPFIVFSIWTLNWIAISSMTQPRPLLCARWMCWLLMSSRCLTTLCFGPWRVFAGAIYAKKGSSKHQWGGRHMILLGDPAQLPAVSSRDIFGTDLWMRSSVLLLQEMKRAKDPQLQSLLEKVRVRVYDEDVEHILCSRYEKEDIAKVDLNATVIICSKWEECRHFNTVCLEMLEGSGMH